MEKKILKHTDLAIAPIIFGGNVFGWTLDGKSSFDILDAFVDFGFNAVDTANQYSYWVSGNKGGESETILGQWMKDRGNRDRVVMMTKVGGAFADSPKPNTTRQHIIEQVERSLKRLQTDYIDLYQTHFDQEETPVEETLRAYEELIKAGKVRYIGASNLSPDRLRESLETSLSFELPRYATLQPEYNVYSRENFETAYKDIASVYELSVIPYFSLASGFLTGKYQSEEDFDKSVRGKGVKDQYWNARGEKIIKALQYVAEQHNTTPSAVALAWLLQQPTVAAPIASATKALHLQPFVDAAGLSFAKEELTLLDQASAY
ncbi:aldo/keto reductase [Sphingobacterium paludis]|uniref:Aryl-alcohol dehydrogenase-like predicted oxidoreductase n=1 Tax=Sphingobacterium paludis TaxID=1476465 RepID=A0A4R7CVN3_9SPHI|nr:aldo/keto reductase [Sphingobacterium paludis]TDS11917.1 aryl-alcohol dehydrogenase-like predicted oxidoreductase [Sphingobacterium paludis]